MPHDNDKLLQRLGHVRQGVLVVIGGGLIADLGGQGD